MYERMKADLSQRLNELEDQGLYKIERVLLGAQGPEITAMLPEGKTIRALNFCANNYLGLANRPELVEAATRAMKEWGYGLSSVRFICGTQEQHQLLEQELSAFLGTEDTILFSSCFDANGGVFEALLDADSAVLTDALNHASIIDGVRLCKARRLIYNQDRKSVV